MGKLIIHKEKVSAENGAKIAKLCPFGAIAYEGGELSISSACKMCKLCAKKSDGAITYEEEEVAQIDKSLWQDSFTNLVHLGASTAPHTSHFTTSAISHHHQLLHDDLRIVL